MPTSPTRSERAAAKARRVARQARREDMLDDIAGGVDYGVVAHKNKVSVKTVRREVERALDARWMASPQRYIRLQVERLNRALRAVDEALLDRDVTAVEPLIRLLDKLDRYHAVAALDLPAPRAARQLALPPVGTKKGTQALEIASRDPVLVRDHAGPD